LLTVTFGIFCKSRLLVVVVVVLVVVVVVLLLLLLLRLSVYLVGWDMG
jgi:hypothetical protein